MALPATPSFFRRTLPETCVAFSSPEGRALLTEAMTSGGDEGWWRLAETFQTQSEPATCALGALAMILNALNIDPNRQWRGSAWRYFDEALLDCCAPYEEVAKNGLTLDAVACLARCNGANALLRRPPPLSAPEERETKVDSCCATRSARSAPCDVSLEDFEAAVREACFAPAASCMLVSYSRRSFGQTGDGHFSPLAAFAPASRMVLLLDVARFKYPPHWVPLEALYEALRPHDSVTGKPRGFLMVSAGGAPSAFLTLSRRRACCNPEREAWMAFLSSPDGALSRALTPPVADGESLASAVRRVLTATNALPDLGVAVELYTPLCNGAGEARQRVLDGMHACTLHAALADAGVEESRADVLTLLLMAANADALACADAGVREALRAKEDSPLAAEVAHIRTQLRALHSA